MHNVLGYTAKVCAANLFNRFSAVQVLNAMCIFKDSAAIQEQGCWFLNVISSQSTTFCLKVRSCNAEEVISAAVHQHGQVPRVVAYAQACLVALQSMQAGEEGKCSGSPMKSAKNKKWNIFSRNTTLSY